MLIATPNHTVRYCRDCGEETRHQNHPGTPEWFCAQCGEVA